MFKSSYLREVRKEKYERSDVFEEEPEDSSAAMSAIQGWENLQELNSRFARYINRARVLEQRNAVFRKQLETLQRMDDGGGLEEAFNEQIEFNRERLQELSAEHHKLERDLKEASRMLDEYTTKYREECEYQEQLRGTLERLNKEADNILLHNLESQIQCQFLQDDIRSTKERHKKDLAEIQTYVNILQQINQTLPLVPNVSLGISEEQERLLAQRKVPGLQSQLEECKSALCQLQGQKSKLHAENKMLEQSIKSTQESYEDEIQTYNQQIESLRKEIEEAEKSLEKFTNECRHLALYQSSLENELERYKRIIESEDNRLNSAIIGTPINLITTNYRYAHTPSYLSRGRDITQDFQDITNIKPRQKNLAKKGVKRSELSTRDVIDSAKDDKTSGEGHIKETKVASTEGPQGKKGKAPKSADVSPQDVPDGAQISKAFDTLCNIVRDRMRRYKKPEPIADFYTKGRYVLVTGDGSYPDPCFYTTTPSAGHIYVTIRDGYMSPYDRYGGDSPTPYPPQPMPQPRPLSPTIPTPKDDPRGPKGKDGGGGKARHKSGDPRPKDAGPISPPTGRREPIPGAENQPGKKSGFPGVLPRIPSSSSSSSSFSPDTMSYEKTEVRETVEKMSNDRKIKGYEETSTVVETLIEKSSKKKH
ncbi:unnamed protein product [Knipowitschia caucasica]|uniref:Filensin n=1 Tax=Knipowitschia caucasica TaxID=637954 RepID=A0AAV2JJ00_KNICA